MTYPNGGASEIWRDGVGGAYNPAKSEIRDWGEAVQLRLDNATALVEQLSAGVTTSLPEFTDVAAGIAGVDDGALFILTPSESALFAPVYKRSNSAALFQGWAGVNLNAGSHRAEMVFMRSRAGRPQYEWDFRFVLDGVKVPNSGSLGATQGDPDNQMLAASGAVYDADGISTDVRRVWPDGVLNALGHAECVEVDFAATSDELWIAQRGDFASMPDTDITIVADIRMASGSQPIIVGSSSNSVGEKTEVTVSTTTQQVTVDMVAWGSSKTYDLAIRPGAAATFPCTVIIERVAIYPTGAAIPTLEQWRANRRAGHAFAAPLAFSGAIDITEGYFEPSETARVLNVDLTGEAVTDFRMSCYVNIDSVADVASGAYAMGFQMDEKPGENMVTNGGLFFESTGNIEYSARLSAYGGDSNVHLAEQSDQIIPGYGWARVDVQLSGIGSDARMRPGDAVASDKRYEVYINGVEHTDVASSPMPDDMKAKLLTIGGNRSNFPDNMVPLASAFPGKIALPRLSINQGRATETEIMAEMLDDLARNRVQIDKPLLHVVTEGDSTSRFSGAPTHWYARELAGSRRMFTNLSQGGRYFSENLVTNDNGNTFNGPNVVAMRRSVMNKTVRDLGCPLTILLYLGGENADTHLDTPADAFADIKAMIDADVAEAQALDPSRKIVTVLQTVRPSGTGGSGSASGLRRAAYNTYLRGLFPTATANSYLFQSSDIAATGFEWMIDLDAWPPASDTETFTDWYDCLADSIANGGNTVISADEQHWAGTTGGKTCAEQVYSPALTIIAADNGLTL